MRAASRTAGRLMIEIFGRSCPDKREKNEFKTMCDAGRLQHFAFAATRPVVRDRNSSVPRRHSVPFVSRALWAENAREFRMLRFHADFLCCAGLSARAPSSFSGHDELPLTELTTSKRECG